MSVLVDAIGEILNLVNENEELRQRVKELEAKRFDNRPKLGTGEVAKIREMRRAGYRIKEIADAFDINGATVSRIVNGQYHK